VERVEAAAGFGEISFTKCHSEKTASGPMAKPNVDFPGTRSVLDPELYYSDQVLARPGTSSLGRNDM
jgi:hypothetical protein